MAVYGLAAVLLGRAAEVTLICIPTRPKHQRRQTRMLEFGVPFQPFGRNHPTAQTLLITALAAG